MSDETTNRGNVPGADDQAQSANKYLDLYNGFLDGATDGEHRRVEIVEESDRTLLVAYNTWVYAERDKETGIVTVYDAWEDKERATNASNLQWGLFRKRIEAMALFERTLLVENVDKMVDVDGNEYESVQVDARPA